MALLLHPPSRKEGLTIVLSAYLDASSDHRREAVVVAGYVANTQTWLKFEGLWRAFLDKYELKRFHAAHFWARSQAFYGWGDTKHEAAFDDLCAVFDEMRPFGVGVALSTDAFDAWRDKLPYFYPEDPHFFCIDRVMKTLIRGVSEYPTDEGVTIYCDRDDERERLALQIAGWHDTKLRSGPWLGPNRPGPSRQVDTHFGSSVDYLPLQAADVLAHATFQHLRDYLKDPDLEGRPRFLERMEKGGHAIGMLYLHSEELVEIESRSKFSADER